jgi:hypothetical protein
MLHLTERVQERAPHDNRAKTDAAHELENISELLCGYEGVFDFVK